MTSFVVTLDIGGSHVTAALVDPVARQVVPGSRRVRHVGHDAPRQDLIAAWAGAALDAAPIAEAPVLGVGIAIPSPFDHARGVSLHRHKFADLHGVNVAQALRDAWAGSALAGIVPAFGNDADLFALGEAWAGRGRGATRVIGVTLGTGLGSGFVDRGQVVTSGPGVPPDGELWDTPYLGGIAEDHVSTRALMGAYERVRHETVRPSGLADRARAGDTRARAVWVEFGAHLAHVLAPHVATFVPDVVVVGGNLSRAWDLFAGPLASLGAPCHPSELLDDAALLGAAAVATPSTPARP